MNHLFVFNVCSCWFSEVITARFRCYGPNSTRLNSTRIDTFDFVEPCFSNMADDEEAVVLVCTSLVFFALSIHVNKTEKKTTRCVRERLSEKKRPLDATILEKIWQKRNSWRQLNLLQIYLNTWMILMGQNSWVMLLCIEQMKAFGASRSFGTAPENCRLTFGRKGCVAAGRICPQWQPEYCNASN